MNDEIKNGIYALTGVEDFSREGWDDTIEGIRIILNNEVYEMYYDPSDGYRSYGICMKVNIPTTAIRFTFPPQWVSVFSYNHHEESEYGWTETDYHGMRILDAMNGKLVLEVGTDYADDYYPIGHYEYHPENLAINEGRK